MRWDPSNSDQQMTRALCIAGLVVLLLLASRTRAYSGGDSGAVNTAPCQSSSGLFGTTWPPATTLT